METPRYVEGLREERGWREGGGSIGRKSVIFSPSFSPYVGADITDYFNYGFTEETWKLYCDKQKKMRGEVSQLNKISVSSFVQLFPLECGAPLAWYSNSNVTSSHYSSNTRTRAVKILAVCSSVVVCNDHFNWKVQCVMLPGKHVEFVMIIILIIVGFNVFVSESSKINYCCVRERERN